MTTPELVDERAVHAGSTHHRRTGRILAWTATIIILLVTLGPFYWVFRVSFTHNTELFRDISFWPTQPTFVNYLRVLGLASPAQQQAEAPGSLQTLNVAADFRNSVVFTAIVAVASVFFSSLASFAFSRLHWRGRDLVFGIFLTALLMPPIFAVLPNFVTVKNLGWIDTWPGLLAPYVLLSPFIMFFLRQFYLNVPLEIEEAAQLDGLTPLGTYWRIIVPSSWAPISTAITIQAVFAWNEYLWPLLVTHTDRTQLLTSALASFVRNSPTSQPDWSGFMTAAAITIVPLLIFAALFGKRLVGNLQFSSAGK